MRLGQGYARIGLVRYIMLHLLGAGARTATAALAPAPKHNTNHAQFFPVLHCGTCLEVKSFFKSNSRESCF
jgi:hypothetical protein